MPLKMGLTSVSAKMRAISSIRAAAALAVCMTSAAVRSWRSALASMPCCARETPVRCSRMWSMYSSIGNICPPTHGTCSMIAS
jgi:hypothetical protein